MVDSQTSILLILLFSLTLAAITCPNITCLPLSSIDTTQQEDQVCYMHDAQNPTSLITTYPCQSG